MKVTWFIVPAIILSFLFLVVPAVLWTVNRLLRKPLGENMLLVSWNRWGILAAMACWIADRTWIWMTH